MKGEKLVGRLATGIGLGKTFTRLDWSRRQFIGRVGIDPYPGTINVIVDDPESMQVWVRLKQTDGIYMDNPNNGSLECDARCWLVTIKARTADPIKGAIVFPLVDGYPPAQVEVIASISVRNAVGIEDGDSVTLVLED